MTSLYESDYPAWMDQQISLLQNRNFEELDLPNLIEELKDYSRWYENLINDNLVALFAHLLVWEYNPEKRNNEWVANISIHYREAKELLDESPTMKAKISELMKDAYLHSKLIAQFLCFASQSRYDFPPRCYWQWDDLDPLVKTIENNRLATDQNDYHPSFVKENGE